MSPSTLNTLSGTALCERVRSQRWKKDRAVHASVPLLTSTKWHCSLCCMCNVCISLCFRSCNSILAFLLRWRYLLKPSLPTQVGRNSPQSHIYFQLETNGALKACLSGLSPAWTIPSSWLPYFSVTTSDVASSALKQIVGMVSFDSPGIVIIWPWVCLLLKHWSRILFFIQCQHCVGFFNGDAAIYHVKRWKCARFHE